MIEYRQHPNVDSWLLSRRGGIGASEIAHVLGLTPYGSREVWAAKGGVDVDLDALRPPTRRMRRGQQLESAILAIYSDEQDDRITPTKLTTAHNSAYPLALCSPDAVVVNKYLRGTPIDIAHMNSYGIDHGIDAKNVGDHTRGWGAQHSDQIPIQYWCQGQWSCLITGASFWRFAVLRGGVDLELYAVVHNPEITAAMYVAAAEWWNKYVRTGIEPPDDHANLDARVRAIAERYPTAGAGMEPAALTDIDLAARLVRTRMAEALCARQRLEIETELKDRIGTSAGLCVPDGPVLASWKNSKPRTDWKAACMDLMQVLDEESRKRLIALHTPATGPRTFLFKPEKRPEKLVEIINALLPRLHGADAEAAQQLMVVLSDPLLLAETSAEETEEYEHAEPAAE